MVKDLDETELTQEILNDKYTRRYTNEAIETYKYIAFTPWDNEILFNTPDFIQGIMTAAQWINIDHHIIVTHLIEVDESGNYIDLTF